MELRRGPAGRARHSAPRCGKFASLPSAWVGGSAMFLGLLLPSSGDLVGGGRGASKEKLYSLVAELEWQVWVRGARGEGPRSVFL